MIVTVCIPGLGQLRAIHGRQGGDPEHPDGGGIWPSGGDAVQSGQGRGVLCLCSESVWGGESRGNKTHELNKQTNRK